MRGNERDDTHELLEKLEQSARQNEADGRPEDVFADQGKGDDATLAKFDSYMAELLDGLIEENDSEEREEPEAQTAEPLSAAEKQLLSIFDDAGSADEPTGIQGEREDAPAPIHEEGMPMPDLRVELSTDEPGVIESEPQAEDEGQETADDAFVAFEAFETIETVEDDAAEMTDEDAAEPMENDETVEAVADETTESPADMDAMRFEVVEQLALGDEDVECAESATVPVESTEAYIEQIVSEREEIPTIEPEQAEPTFEPPLIDEGPTEISPDRPAYEFSDEVDEEDEEETAPVTPAPAMREDAPSEPAVAEPEVQSVTEEVAQTATAEAAETELAEAEQGDIVLDAEAEIPPIELPVQPANENEEILVESAVPTPMPSVPDALKAEEKMTAEAPRPKQSPLDAMAAKSHGNVSGLGNSAFGNRGKSERALTDEDVALMLDLGYDINLTQKVGAQRVESVRYRRQDDERTRRRLRRAYGCAGEEYMSHTQDKQISAAYRAHVKTAIVRLALGVVITFMLLLCDLVPLLGHELTQALGISLSTGVFGTLGVMLLVFESLLLWPQLLRGWNGLLRMSPVPASVPALLLLMTLAYDLLVVPTPAIGGVLLNFPMGMILLLFSLSELLTVQCESMTFDVVSAHSRKIVMERIPPRKKKVARGGRIVKIINDEGGRRAWRVHPTDHVAGYFGRSVASTARYRYLSVLIALSVALSVLVGVLTLVLTESPEKMATALLLTAQLTMPAVALFAFAYPMLLAARQLAPEGCAIIGQSAVDEYAGEKTLIFDDTEMFRSKSSTEITIKGSGDTKKYIRYAKRLFSTLGGTLHGITTSDLTSETYEERVEILRVDDQGVEARIDGKVQVIAGTSAHMTKHGIRVPSESAELLVRRNVESCIVYLAFDGQLRLGYEVDYRISGRFEQVAEELLASGTAVAIETCDPSIHEDFLARSRRAGASPVAVLKPIRFERRRDSALCNSGVVATRSARDIALGTAACDRLLANDKQLRLFMLIATLGGAVLSCILNLLGFAMESSTLVAAILQIVWCLPVIMLTRKNMMNEQRAENENVNRSREQ